MRVCIVGASGKLGRYMVQHALDKKQQQKERRLAAEAAPAGGFAARLSRVRGATTTGVGGGGKQ